jgi:hypothetical protein
MIKKAVRRKIGMKLILIIYTNKTVQVIIRHQRISQLPTVNKAQTKTKAQERCLNNKEKKFSIKKKLKCFRISKFLRNRNRNF